MSHRSRQRLARAALLAASSFASPAALSGTFTWSSPNSGSWSTPANWVNNLVPNTVPGFVSPAVLFSPAGSPYTVTIDTPVTIGYLTLAAGATASLELANSATLTLATKSDDSPLTPSLYTNYPTILSGNGTLQLDGPVPAYIRGTPTPGASPSLTFAPGITVRTGSQGATLANFVNQGAISAHAPGSTVWLRESFSNTGLLEATDGATIAIAANTTTAALGSFRSSNGGAISIHGYPNYITLDNTSTALNLTASTGTLSFQYVTVKGGSLTTADDLVVTVGPGTTFKDVHLAASMRVLENTLTLDGSTTLDSAAISLQHEPPIGATGALSARQLAGSAVISFDSTTSSSASVGGLAGQPLVIDPGILVRTGAGSGTVTFGTNHGTLAAQTPGKSLTANGANWTNSGTLTATSNSTLYLAGTFSTAGLGTLQTSSGGKAYITGSLNNTSATLPLSAASSLGLAKTGSITGGSITTPDDTPLLVHSDAFTASLTSVDTDAPVSLSPGARLLATDVTFRRPLTLNQAQITLSGGIVMSGLTATAGSQVNLAAPLPPSLAFISATDSTVRFKSPFTAAQLDSLPRNGTRVALAAPLDNTGNALVASDISPLTLDSGGSIVGGSLFLQSPNALSLPPSHISPAGTLDSVTLLSDLFVRGSTTLGIRNGITLSGATINLGSPTENTFDAYVTFSGNALVSGDGEVVANIAPNGSYHSTLTTLSPADSVTFGPGITIRTGTNTLQLGGTAAGAITVAGTLSAQTSGNNKELRVLSPITLTGTAEARNGGKLYFETRPANLSGNTLTGGTWNVSDNSTIYFNSSFSTNAATITLSGRNSTFGNLYLANNAGSLTITNNRALRPDAPFTNTGTITVGPSSILILTTAVFTNTGVIDLRDGGMFAIDYISGINFTALRAHLATGHLTSSTAPDSNHRLGYFERSLLPNVVPSSGPGGAFLDATTVIVKLTLAGDANFDNRVDAADFALLDRSVALNLAGAKWTDGDFTYDGKVTAADYLLIDTTLAHQQGGHLSPDLLAQRQSQFGPDYVSTLLTSIPEPSLLLSSILHPLSSFFLRRRRQI